MVSLASQNTCGHSPNAWPAPLQNRLGGDDDRGLLIEAAAEAEQQLPDGQRERLAAELVGNNEFDTREMFADADWRGGASLGLKPLDQIDGVGPMATSAQPDPSIGAHAVAPDGDGEMDIASSGAADQDCIALLHKEPCCSQVFDPCVIDRHCGKAKLGQLLGQPQFCNGHLILERAHCGRRSAQDDQTLVPRVMPCGFGLQPPALRPGCRPPVGPGNACTFARSTGCTSAPGQ